MIFLGWSIDLDLTDNDQWQEMQSYLLAQGLVETDSDAPLSNEAKCAATERGKRVWLMLEAARAIETGQFRAGL